jgi:hypothetical protein
LAKILLRQRSIFKIFLVPDGPFSLLKYRLIYMIDTTCVSTRVGEGGTLFNSTISSTWKPLGLFTLGADSQLGNTGQAQYGFDALTFGTTGVVLPSAIIGSFTGIGPVTGAQYITGMFGLGVTPGNFTTAVSTPAINGLVALQDGIPSYTYGYTAGATYRKSYLGMNLPMLMSSRAEWSTKLLDSWRIRCKPLYSSQHLIQP